MEALRHALEEARTGHGQIVAAMAEPGVGKSRLFHEFLGSSTGRPPLEQIFRLPSGASDFIIQLNTV